MGWATFWAIFYKTLQVTLFTDYKKIYFKNSKIDLFIKSLARFQNKLKLVAFRNATFFQN
jgi:hypothetical protein